MRPRYQPIDPAAIPLDGIHLIEASAGTGKTHTITSLYLRLILEGCRVDEILVVTFTEAATSELRARIRQRLYDALSLLNTGGGEDEVLCRHLASAPDADAAEKRIRTALSGFDENGIFTIHAFCLQVLRENAFESGIPFDAELVTDCRPLYEQIVNDFWARNVFTATPLFASYLMTRKVVPGDFMRLLAAAAPQPERTILPAAAADVDAETLFTKAYAAAQEALSGREAQIIALIRSHPAVNRRSYTSRNTSVWLNSVGGFLAPATPRRVFSAGEDIGKHIHRFTRAGLSGGAAEGPAPPDDPFFDACEDLLAAALLFEQKLLVLKRRFIGEALVELERCKQERGIQFFDDLILQLARALKEDRGEPLARKIRRRFPVGLIDEFQDTDQAQYDIFRRIYHCGGPSPPRLFMIGDPKQSIYAFRNADVFAYLKAAGDVRDRVYTLGINWRSGPGLIKAVNTLFGRVDFPFLFREIQFAPVAPRKDAADALMIDGRRPPPLQILFVRPGDDLPVKDRIPAMVAAQVADLFARETTIAMEGERMRLSPGHIAILTRTNRQAEAVKEALLNLEIPSVLASKESVFASREAVQLIRFLEAVSDPGDEGKLKAVLAGDLFGLCADEIHCLNQDDDAWEAWVNRFRSWHEQWEKAGFIRMIQEVWALSLGAETVLARMLSLHNGERRVTNLGHLVELAHGTAKRLHLKMAGIIGWLKQQQAQAVEGSVEASELRLESDEDAVKILTIHKSKGLEFPVVFCPYLWEGHLFAARAPEAVFHEPSGRAPVLDLGSESLAAHQRLAQQEEMAENLRLVYVALTRARHLCHVIWTPSPNAGTSPLGYLLLAPADCSDPWEADRRIQDLDADAMLECLHRLEESAQGCIAVNAALGGPPKLFSLKTPGPQRLKNGQPDRIPQRLWQVASYSSLISPSRTAAAFQREGLDRDADKGASPVFGSRPQPANPAPGAQVLLPETFRGEKAGSAIHSILEGLDFTSLRIEQLLEQVARQLDAFGLDAATWTGPVSQTVADALATPLDADIPGLRLQCLAREDRRCELEFYMPVRNRGDWHLDPVFWKEFIRVVARHGRETLPVSYLRSLARLNAAPLKGFLKGYIDLVFAYEGRFYIADYKTNFLGSYYRDYSRTSLEQQMAEHHYHLQSLIYSVALHRYLSFRLEAYDYDTHFGAVYYLFLRGMSPAGGPAGGIWSNRPSKNLVLALSSLFHGNEAEAAAQ